MATGDLSLKITVGSTAYYVSDDEYVADDGNFHYGYVLNAPVMTLGATRGGYANFRSGFVVLENRPLDDSHPFGSSRYTSMVSSPSTTYVFVLKTTLTGYDWITGVLVIENITEESLRFTMYPFEYTQSPVSTVTDSDGNTVTAPWVYGSVTNFNNLVQTGSTTFHNPTGLTSGLTFKEDGSTGSISAGYSATSFTVSTYGGGQATLSSSTSKTLEDFFDYVASTLSLTVTSANTAKATGASSLGIKIRQEQPMPLVLIASSVAEAFNHQFYIGPNTADSNRTTLFLIDRANNPTSFTTFEEDEIVDASFQIGFPVGGISATYKVVEIESNKVTEYSEYVRVENKPIGSEFEVPAYADTYADRSQVSTLLTAIKNNDVKASASVTMPDIQTSYNLGDRFKFGREIDFVNCDMIARSITYNFQNRTTTLSGDADLSAYVRTF
jgi:hypothetical protein